MERFLKLPSFIVYAIVFGSIAAILFYTALPYPVFITIILVLIAAIHLWYLAVSAFLVRVLNRSQTEYIILSALVVISLILNLTTIYLDHSLPEDEDNELLETLRHVFLLPVIIVLIIRTKKYLYARSWWYLILEVLVPVMGMLTLSPALLEEERERSKPSGDAGNSR